MSDSPGQDAAYSWPPPTLASPACTSTCLWQYRVVDVPVCVWLCERMFIQIAEVLCFGCIKALLPPSQAADVTPQGNSDAAAVWPVGEYQRNDVLGACACFAHTSEYILLQWSLHNASTQAMQVKPLVSHAHYYWLHRRHRTTHSFCVGYIFCVWLLWDTSKVRQPPSNTAGSLCSRICHTHRNVPHTGTHKLQVPSKT